ncbi:hypothetical protein M8J75_002007 [Diaphorina citri]|nr:hypothetical protein M8J75_002007 [Diaphorina citri]
MMEAGVLKPKLSLPIDFSDMGPVVLLVLSVSSWVGAETFRPTDLTVVGILSQEYVFSPGLAHDYQGHKSYIAASYVKAVEASGAMVVPVFIGQTQEYYENIMNHINGLIIPGGAAYFNFTNGYKDAGKNLIHIAQKMNSRGDYFPILGICLGFELLLFVENKEKELRTDCNCFHENLSLRFLKNGSKTGLYKTFPKKSLKALAKNNITYNYHM